MLLVLLVILLGIYFFTQSNEILDNDLDEGSLEEQEVADEQDVVGISYQDAVSVGHMMQDYIVQTIGQPIEGFEPAMFLEAFPGLEASDFNYVLSEQGMYYYIDGELIWEKDPEIEFEHSAGRAITDRGLVNIFQNSIIRLEYDARSKADLERLVEILKQ